MNMDNKTDERDLRLLEGDRYTFAVLSRILGTPCRLILTDHERLIICHSVDPFPVWIWTPDGVSEDEARAAWDIVSRECPLDKGYRYNLKYELAGHFAAIAAKQGKNAVIETNMFAYDCPEPREPAVMPDGRLHKCGREDIETETEIIRLFHDELDLDRQETAQYRAEAERLINAGQAYFWINGDGEAAANCSYTPNGELVSINGVYTMPEQRRKHYAARLVYEVTKIAAGTGALPMLYTDADYRASNACYESIGYILRGKLCTIAAGPADNDNT